MTDVRCQKDLLRRSLVVVASFAVGLAVFIGGLHGDGYLSTRGAYGALAGLAVALVVLALAAVVVTRTEVTA